ncbi:hypothetical protein ACFQ1E_19410 [Sphingomonas canadensis]|uniref:Holin n=1 Tax=Sphingomonas canadensis TaxID=1219257 RepID=A0ABW3HAJ8_9SPHN|nr:hypothetical protein [Sphingomonas canadensis]MCW3838148.1 hypothetical protein [Sphingomonas canadensis]
MRSIRGFSRGTMAGGLLAVIALVPGVAAWRALVETLQDPLVAAILLGVAAVSISPALSPRPNSRGAGR